jgi:hypothetical protein
VPSSGSLIGKIVLIVQICTAYPRPPDTERDFAIGAGGYDRIPESARHGLSIMSWSRAFHVPITTPDSLMLRTLRDAGEYMQALPRAKSQRPEWQTAAEMLLEAVEGKGPLMFAEIAMRKAVNT